MKFFTCPTVIIRLFENTFCIHCNASLGFDAETLQPVALTVEMMDFFYHGKKEKTFYTYAAIII